MTVKNSVSGEMLRSFVERLERLKQQKKGLTADEGVVKAEIKAAGLDPKLVLQCLKVRAATPSEMQEAEALKDMYLSALGLLPEPPLFRAVGLIDVDTAARESVVEAMKRFVPVNGSIVVKAEGGKPMELKRGADGIVTVSEVVERAKPDPSPAAAPTRARKPAEPVPEASDEEAERLGFEAARSDVPAVRNPFPYGDRRRGLWDKGWRDGAGSDGMGPDD